LPLGRGVEGGLITSHSITSRSSSTELDVAIFFHILDPLINKFFQKQTPLNDTSLVKVEEEYKFIFDIVLIKTLQQLLAAWLLIPALVVTCHLIEIIFFW